MLLELFRKSSIHRAPTLYNLNMQQIKALRFDIDEVGKHVKGSKKRFTWELALKDRSHTIGLDFSFISGKVKITVDRKCLLQNQLPSNVSFQYPFTLDGFALNVIQQGETFQLRINNKVFSHLYNQQKTNTQFRKYEQQVKDIKVDPNQFNQDKKKISLNIGAFGGNAIKKRQSSSNQGQNWDAFGGNNMSFPSYFEGALETDSPNDSKVQYPTNPIKKQSLLDDDQSQTPVSQRVQGAQNPSVLDISPPTQNSFGFQFGSQPKQDNRQSKTASEQFSTMQQMFKTLNLNLGPPKQQSSAIDFFASLDEPKSQAPKAQNTNYFQTTNTGGQNLILGSSNTGLSFNTTNLAGLQYGQELTPPQGPLLTSLTMPQMQPLPQDHISIQQVIATTSGNNFGIVSEKKNLNQFNLGSISLVTAPDQQKSVNAHQFNTISGNTSIPSLNTFATTNLAGSQFSFDGLSIGPSQQQQASMMKRPQPNSQPNFNLMFAAQPQTTAQPQTSSSPTANLTNVNINDYSTMQLMFQTNSIGSTSFGMQGLTQQIPQQNIAFSSNTNLHQNIQAPTPANNTFNMFSSSVPVSMSTMSGSASNKSGIDFNIANFGTMQANQKIDLNSMDFLGKPAPVKPESTTNDLI